MIDLAFAKEYNIRERLVEWGMAAAMLGAGLLILSWPQSISTSEYRYIQLLMSAPFVGVFLMLTGTFRIIALIINGRSVVYGPRIRAWCSLLGAVIWAQMLIALLIILPEKGWVPSPGIPFWLVLVFLELLSAYLAATDVRRST